MLSIETTIMCLALIAVATALAHDRVHDTAKDFIMTYMFFVVLLAFTTAILQGLVTALRWIAG